MGPQLGTVQTHPTTRPLELLNCIPRMGYSKKKACTPTPPSRPAANAAPRGCLCEILAVRCSRGAMRLQCIASGGFMKKKKKEKKEEERRGIAAGLIPKKSSFSSDEAIIVIIKGDPAKTGGPRSIELSSLDWVVNESKEEPNERDCYRNIQMRIYPGTDYF